MSALGWHIFSSALKMMTRLLLHLTCSQLILTWNSSLITDTYREEIFSWFKKTLHWTYLWNFSELKLINQAYTKSYAYLSLLLFLVNAFASFMPQNLFTSKCTKFPFMAGSTHTHYGVYSTSTYSTSFMFTGITSQ